MNKRLAAGAGTDRLALMLLIVSLGSALGPFSNTIYMPNLVALRDAFQTTSTWAGATFSVFAFVLAVSQLAAGPLADRFSAKRLLVGGLVLYSAASVVAYLATSIEIFIVARALQAAGAATGLVVGGAIVSDRYPPEGRPKAMATLQMFNAIGGTAGPLVGSALAVAFFWQASSLALCVAGLLVTLGAVRYLPPIAASAERLTPSAVVAVIRYPLTGAILLIAFVQYLGHFTYIAYVPLVLREHAGVPEWAIGWLFLPHTLGVLVGAHFGGRLAQRYGNRCLLFVGAGLTAVFAGLYAAVIMADLGGWTLLVLSIVNAGFSINLGLGVPVQLALMVERFSKNRGAAVGTYACIRYFGGATGPVLAGLFLERFGLASGFAAAAVALALGAVAARLLIDAPAADREQQKAPLPR